MKTGERQISAKQRASGMAKSIAWPVARGAARVLIRHGRFALVPVKRLYTVYVNTVPRLIYNVWATQNETKCFVQDVPKSRPLVSVVVPVYNPEHRHLLEMVYSVVNQHYERWELVLVNGSTDKASREQVEACQHIDTRIRIVDLPKNLGIAGNTNKGLEACKGDYVAFFDHDDLMHPCALHCAVTTINRTGAELIYTDEDKINDGSTNYFAPFLKPKWSPDLLRNVNYFNHLTIAKRSMIEKVGGLRAECNGAQDYDFLLRVIDECKPQIVHIPRVLYHWRAAKSSTASNFSVKAYVLKAGTDALQAHLDRNGIKGIAQAVENRPGFYETLFPKPKAISIAVGPVDAPNHRLCVAWLEKLCADANDVKVELIVGDWFAPYRAKVTAAVRLVSEQEKYWPAAAASVSHKTVVCFAGAALPLHGESGALVKIAAAATQTDVVVSPVLVGEDGTIMDAGLVESAYGKQQLFRGSKLGEDSYYGSTEWVRDVAGLTLEVFATSAEMFASIAKNARGDALNDGVLQQSANKTTRFILYPHAPFLRKGALKLPNLINNDYFNPQLTQAHSSIDVRLSAWSKLEQAVSERAHE